MKLSFIGDGVSDRNKMNRISLMSYCLAIWAALSACSTDLDLYADYKDIPVVYGLLDADQDTNYIKIFRGFTGTNENHINALEVAMIPDSNQYPGKLDARIIELKSSYEGGEYLPTGNVFHLDTITIHDKDPGIFYSPDQKVYYTIGNIKKDQAGQKYRYRLQILKDTDTITSETGIVGDDNFQFYISQVEFSEYFEEEKHIYFPLVNNGVIYEMRMILRYQEKHPGQPVVNRDLNWSLGTFSVDEIPNEYGEFYFVNYSTASLFKLLGRQIGGDTLNVERSVEGFYISLAAGGMELNNYIVVNGHANGLNQGPLDYSNLQGAYGLFSSRSTIVSKMRLSSTTLYELNQKSGWGF